MRRFDSDPRLQNLSRLLKTSSIGARVNDLTIAILGLAFVCCLLFGFVAFINAHISFKRVQGQPYHATTFQVTRSYYQKSAGMHGPDISIYARGMVEGQAEWMDLFA